MGLGREPLFEGVQATTTTIAVPIPIVAGCIGVQVAWTDATTAATFVLELSSYPEGRASVGAGGAGTQLAGGGHAYLAGTAAQFWFNSGETIAPVVAAAAGSFGLNLSNVRQQRARLLITSTADCDWEIWQGVQDV